MKKLLMAVAIMACVFTASADDSDSRPWLPLGISLVTPPLQLPSMLDPMYETPGSSIKEVVIDLDFAKDKVSNITSTLI